MIELSVALVAIFWHFPYDQSYVEWSLYRFCLDKIYNEKGRFYFEFVLPVVDNFKL